MKVCPNCGAQMDKSVNFCTNCGADLRDVAEKQAATTTSAADRRDEAAKTRKSVTHTAANQTTTSEKATTQTAVKNTRANNYWNWLLASWKKPAAFQKVESWFGWVTILVENLIYVLGITIAVHNLINNAGGYNGISEQVGAFSNNILLQLLLYLLFVEAATIAGAFAGHKFIYQDQISFLDFVNQVAQGSNLSVILVVISFICFLTGSANLIAFSLVFGGIGSMFLNISLFNAILAGEKAARDRIYGLLIFSAIALVCFFIFTSIFGGTVIEQILRLAQVNFSSFF